jgi:hypothetical protein
MDGPELYAMLTEELDAEGIQAREWGALADRAQLAWLKLARRITREMRPSPSAQPMLSEYPD